ncbi:MAG: hypothetical protein Q8M94_14065 [Ignavibacteria bacterium]|nr:hypothetical protein [Ignavibacteria bacterium]
MKKKYLPYTISLKSEYGELQKLLYVEGGGYYFTSKNNKYYVLSDYGTLIDFFEDDEDVLSTLKAEYEFDSKEECKIFIEKLIVDTKNEKRNIRIPEALL